jgi:hypothetical protein
MFQDNDDIAHRTTGQSDEGGEVKWLFSCHTIARRHTLDMFGVLLDLCLRTAQQHSGIHLASSIDVRIYLVWGQSLAAGVAGMSHINSGSFTRCAARLILHCLNVHLHSDTQAEFAPRIGLGARQLCLVVTVAIMLAIRSTRPQKRR